MGQKYASLHAGLLARKGEAMPASRPGLVPGLIERAGPAAEPNVPERPARSTPQPRPAPPQTTTQAGSAPQPLKPVMRVQDTAKPASSARHKTTLRLSPAQKRRLRLAAAVLDRSQQSLISEALDEFLDILAADPALDCRCLSRCSGTGDDAQTKR
ncbi:hypothetical protein [Maricaulis sp.]|uniref:hypothetical protein n=1 Tax=Maricaulis sp. TaxID=1486257 RepID=UPI002631CA81|nr:hypothetical protein [Maricaulis sp.]